LEFKLSENQLTELLVAHFAKYRFFISQITDFHFAKYRFSFRKLQIFFILQITDFHFAYYRFSFRKLQIFISQITDFAKYRFSFRFVPFPFISQITVSPNYIKKWNSVHANITFTWYRHEKEMEEDKTQATSMGLYNNSTFYNNCENSHVLIGSC